MAIVEGAPLLTPRQVALGQGAVVHILACSEAIKAHADRHETAGCVVSIARLSLTFKDAAAHLLHA